MAEIKETVRPGARGENDLGCEEVGPICEIDADDDGAVGGGSAEGVDCAPAACYKGYACDAAFRGEMANTACCVCPSAHWVVVALCGGEASLDAWVESAHLADLGEVIDMASLVDDVLLGTLEVSVVGCFGEQDEARLVVEVGIRARPALVGFESHLGVDWVGIVSADDARDVYAASIDGWRDVAVEDCNVGVSSPGQFEGG